MAKIKIKNQKSKIKTTTQRSKLFSGFKTGVSKLAPKFLLITGIFLISGWIFHSFLLPKDQFQQIREKILTDPHDLEAHLDLAKIYLENNQFDQAEKELKNIPGFNDSKNLREEINALWQEKKEKDPEEIRKQAQEWEKLLVKYPDFRDGYLQLTLLYLKLDENEKANKSLGKALALSPNYEAAKELGKTYFSTD